MSGPPGTEADIHFRRLLQGLPAAAYTCDRDGLITYYNPRAEQLWGYAPPLNHPSVRFGGAKKIYGKDGQELSHESSWMARAIREQREFGSQEIVIGRPDGSRVTVLAHASPLRDEEGNVIGGVNVLIDIDERKRAELVQTFLADVSIALAQLTDYESTLERIANLAVPTFATGSACTCASRADACAGSRCGISRAGARRTWRSSTAGTRPGSSARTGPRGCCRAGNPSSRRISTNR
jgi:PAS domain S-box-containing protein